MDSRMAFWLRYVESRGGLWERSGDRAHVMIPPQLQHRLGLPEEFAVTEHPDVAREDHATLLGAGHPLLAAAAEDVLSADDAGVLTLAVPAPQPPDAGRLLETARDQFPVDHGRIDASGPPERRLRQALRVGALVTYTASADEQFLERAECWVDVPSRHELPQEAVKRMRRFISEVPGTDNVAPALQEVPAALLEAHLLLEQAASSRCQVLAGGSVSAAASAELARARTYYSEALSSLARRQANAAPDRRALLAARADSVRAEQERRLAEIEEKHASRYEIRPYRLHLLRVPVLRLPVDVLRGSRRFPMVLEWLLPAGLFAPVRCPGCGASAARSPLVAAKTQLGCANCLSGATPALAAPPPSASAAPPPPAAPPRPTPAQASHPAPPPAGARPATAKARPAATAKARATTAKARPAATAKARPAATAKARPAATAKARPLDPQALSKVGDKLAMEFWSVSRQGNLRALRRQCAADSPAAAAIRLYGTSGPAVSVGLAANESPESLTSVTSQSPGGGLAGTSGYLQTGHAQYTYLLRWHPDTRLVAEVLPFGSWVSARLPSPRWLFTPAAVRMFEGLAEPDTDLDPVAIRLWRRSLPQHGLPLTLRCLAAWWRTGDGPALLAAHRPSVLAAAIHRMVGYRAGEPGTSHDAVADLYRVAADDTRAITPHLQARLRLSPAQPW